MSYAKNASQSFFVLIYSFDELFFNWMNDNPKSEFARACAAASGTVSVLLTFVSGLLWSISSGKIIRGEGESPAETHVAAIVCFWVGFMSLLILLLSVLFISNEQEVQYERIQGYVNETREKKEGSGSGGAD